MECVYPKFLLITINYKNIRGLPKNLSKNPLTNLVANEDKILIKSYLNNNFLCYNVNLK